MCTNLHILEPYTTRKWAKKRPHSDLFRGAWGRSLCARSSTHCDFIGIADVSDDLFWQDSGLGFVQKLVWNCESGRRILPLKLSKLLAIGSAAQQTATASVVSVARSMAAAVPGLADLLEEVLDDVRDDVVSTSLQEARQLHQADLDSRGHKRHHVELLVGVPDDRPDREILLTFFDQASCIIA